MKKILILFCLIMLAPLSAQASSLTDHLRSAQKQIKNNKLEPALKTLLDAQIDYPNDALLDYYLGQVYYKMQRYQDADSSFKRALRTDKANLRADSTYALGNTAFKQGQLKEAIEYFTKYKDFSDMAFNT